MGGCDRDQPAIADRLCDRSIVVGGVDHEHLVVVAHQEHIVLDVEVLAVEGEDAGRLDDVDHRSNTTTERSTSPRCIFSKASSMPSSGIVSETKRSRSSCP